MEPIKATPAEEHSAASVIKEYLFITAAVIILDIGTYVFKFPNHFSFGGVSGLAVILAELLPFTASQINFVINMGLLVLGFSVLGRDFGVKTAYVTILSSVLLDVMEAVVPLSAPLTDQLMLEFCFAILLPALATALLFYVNASSGGTDIIAMIIQKYSTMNISTALLWSDVAIACLSFVVFDVRTGLCSVLGLMIKTLVVDKALEHMHMNKYCTIITTQPDVICEYINYALNHTATLYKAEGAYSHQEKTVILTVVNATQAVYLERYVKAIDPGSFIMMTKSSETVGKGFLDYI